MPALDTTARDCLYLNWAVPAAALPEPPSPLRYELHAGEGVDQVFVTALLFRLSKLRPRGLPVARLSYPQMSLRLYVLDGDGVPSVLFRRLIVPPWVVPVSRWLGRQPARAGLFSFPRPSRSALRDGDGWRWVLRCRGTLQVEAQLASPQIGPGPDLGDWRSTLLHFRSRQRAYVHRDGAVRRLDRTQPPGDVWPVRAHVQSAAPIVEALPGVAAHRWSAPHSAWLCPEIALRFALRGAPLAALRRNVAAVPDGA
ncbi:MAG: DUF2071 domain-containing protein [Acidobacteriota bacterium]